MYAILPLPFNVYLFRFEVKEQFLYCVCVFIALVCEKILSQDNFTTNYIYMGRVRIAELGRETLCRTDRGSEKMVIISFLAITVVTK